MAIQLACSAYVEYPVRPPVCAWQKLGLDVETYLEQHVADLVRKAERNTAPPANFVSARGRQAFGSLAGGTNGEFFDAAQALATSLFDAMDGRTKRGLFVALRRDQKPSVAVLKLDVVQEHAASLGPGGDIQPVDDLLDTTGALQKGAITPDWRPNSKVVVGDKLGDASQYFLDALDISQWQKPAAAVADLARVLQQKAPPDKAEQAIARLVGSDAPTVAAFLDSVDDVLDAKARKEVLAELAAQTRPARYLDASTTVVKKTIRGDGITVTGSVAAMQKANLTPIQGTDQVRLEIVFDEPPEVIF